MSKKSYSSMAVLACCSWAPKHLSQNMRLCAGLVCAGSAGLLVAATEGRTFPCPCMTKLKKEPERATTSRLELVPDETKPSQS